MKTIHPEYAMPNATICSTRRPLKIIILPQMALFCKMSMFKSLMGGAPSVYAEAWKMNTRKNGLGGLTSLDLEVEQMHVKTALLHGDLDKEIYMEQPEGFQVKGKEDYMCRLQKSLYGPDISHALELSRFLSNPGKKHWEARGTPVSGQSRLSKCVALSTTEAEYVQPNASKELFRLKRGGGQRGELGCGVWQATTLCSSL
ncbi:retrovirus-related pol polyprotein from transposon TNT 1-94 [Tanacetum coccineum]